jgi:hypothetical protein
VAAAREEIKHREEIMLSDTDLDPPVSHTIADGWSRFSLRPSGQSGVKHAGMLLNGLKGND